MQCSAAVSWTARARERDVIGVGAGAREPRSMRIGVLPSSAIMMLPIKLVSKPFTSAIGLTDQV